MVSLKNNYKKVEIEWVDSVRGDAGWEFIDEIEPVLPARCKTVGFLIDEKPEYKTVALTVSDKQLFARITIPTVAILKIRKIGK